jgi:demethylmenaquinone methyltransferase / 2-methoxy-6-polyprenyl-1,4-benzoquinol methylase
MNKEITPYNQSEDKKEQVAAMFDNIAHKYDFLNGFLSLGIDKYWRKRMLSNLKELENIKMLDVATGTADVAIAAAKFDNVKSILGVDISRNMLDIGIAKIKNLNLDRKISLELGDSENLRFEDNSFDVVTVAFGVRNFEDLNKGLSEINRITKQGGKLIVLEFSKPKLFPFKQLYNIYFKYVLPLIGKLTSKDNRAYTYLYESVQSFPDGERFMEELIKTGYTSNSCTSLTLGICSIYVGYKR